MAKVQSPARPNLSLGLAQLPAQAMHRKSESRSAPLCACMCQIPQTACISSDGSVRLCLLSMVWWLLAGPQGAPRSVARRWAARTTRRVAASPSLEARRRSEVDGSDRRMRTDRRPAAMAFNEHRTFGFWRRAHSNHTACFNQPCYARLARSRSTLYFTSLKITAKRPANPPPAARLLRSRATAPRARGTRA